MHANIPCIICINAIENVTRKYNRVENKGDLVIVNSHKVSPPVGGGAVARAEHAGEAVGIVDARERLHRN